MWNDPWYLKVIITYTFCCDNLRKSIFMALEKPGKLREFFLLLCGLPVVVNMMSPDVMRYSCNKKHHFKHRLKEWWCDTSEAAEMGKDVATKQRVIQISVLLSNILKTFLILLYFMCCITVQLQFPTYSFLVLVQFFCAFLAAVVWSIEALGISWVAVVFTYYWCEAVS